MFIFYTELTYKNYYLGIQIDFPEGSWIYSDTTIVSGQ